MSFKQNEIEEKQTKKIVISCLKVVRINVLYVVYLFIYLGSILAHAMTLASMCLL